MKYAFAVFLAFFMASYVCAQGTDDSTFVCPVRKQTMSEFTYFYKAAKCKVADIGKLAEATVPALIKTVNDQKIARTGQVVFIYKGIDNNPQTEFTLEIGIMVAAETKPVAGFEVRKVEAFKCASTLLWGSMEQAPNAYLKLFSDPILQNGRNYTGECRHYCLHFDKTDPTNGVTQISVGISD